MAKKDGAGEAKIGHNSNLNPDEKRKLAGFVSEIERVAEEMRSLSSDRAEIYKRAKAEGFDNKAVKEAVKLRLMKADAREVFLNTVDAYLEALGALSDTPLGRAAMARDGVSP